MQCPLCQQEIEIGVELSIIKNLSSSHIIYYRISLTDFTDKIEKRSHNERLVHQEVISSMRSLQLG